MADERDISRIVSALSEKPELISEVMRLVDSAPTAPERSEGAAASVAEAAEAGAFSPSENGGQAELGGGRRKLLGALKPYLSEGRARAIDTMMSLSDILYMMRTR